MSRVRPKRATPRRRDAPRWSADEWQWGNTMLMLRCAGKCECCGQPLQHGSIERHHRQRRAVGGDRFANLLVLASDHHRYWTEHPAEAMRRGIIVSSYEPDPGLVPFWWRNVEWRMLDDASGLVHLPENLTGVSTPLMLDTNHDRT